MLAVGLTEIRSDQILSHNINNKNHRITTPSGFGSIYISFTVYLCLLTVILSNVNLCEPSGVVWLSIMMNISDFVDHLTCYTNSLYMSINAKRIVTKHNRSKANQQHFRTRRTVLSRTIAGAQSISVHPSSFIPPDIIPPYKSTTTVR